MSNPEAVIWLLDYFEQNGYFKTFIEYNFRKKETGDWLPSDQL